MGGGALFLLIILPALFIWSLITLFLSRRWREALVLIGILAGVLLFFLHSEFFGPSWRDGLLSSLDKFHLESLGGINSVLNYLLSRPLLLLAGAFLLLGTSLIITAKFKKGLRLTFSLLIIFLFFLFAYLAVSTSGAESGSLNFLSRFWENLGKLGQLIAGLDITLTGLIILAATFSVFILLIRSKNKNPRTYLLTGALSLGITAKLISFPVLPLGLLLGGLSLVLLLGARFAHRGTAQELSLSPFARKILLGVIIIFWMLLGLYQLNLYPLHFHSYEAKVGLISVRLREAVVGVAPFFRSAGIRTTIDEVSPVVKILWGYPGHGHASLACSYRTPFSVYPTALFLKIFPWKVTTYRLAGIFWGVIALLLIYLSGKALANPRAGLLAALFLATSSWNLYLSRLNMNLESTVAYSLLICFLLAGAVKRGRMVFWILLGAALSFNMHFYVPSKLLIYLVIAVLIIKLLGERGFWRNNYPGILVFALVLFFFLYLQKINPRQYFLYWKRLGADYAWEGGAASRPFLKDALAALERMKNYGNSALQLFCTRYPQNLYSAFTERTAYLSPFLFGAGSLGLVWSLLNFKKTRWLIPGLGLLGAIAIGVLGSPMSRRLLLILPFICLSAALYLEEIIGALGGRKIWIITAILSLFLAAGALNDYFRVYYRFENTEFNFSVFKKPRPFRNFFHRMLPDHFIYICSYAAARKNFIDYLENDTLALLAYSRSGGGKRTDLFRILKYGELEEIIPLLAERKEKVIIAAADNQRYRGLLNKIKNKYPRSKLNTFYDFNESPLFLYLQIDPVNP